MVYAAHILGDDKNQELGALEQRIAVLREKLQRLYEATGGTDEAVLLVSIEMDEALNEYEKLKA